MTTEHLIKRIIALAEPPRPDRYRQFLILHGDGWLRSHLAALEADEARRQGKASAARYREVLGVPESRRLDWRSA